MILLKSNQNTDFSFGPVWRRIVAQAIPLTLAQLVHLLYNIVDRIYIGHMDVQSSLALTGLGLTFPVVTLVMAFTALFGNGGVPLFSIARGEGNDQKASRIMQHSFILLMIASLILTFFCYMFCRPILFAFGAGETSYKFAEEYLTVYLTGTLFSMISTGMNGYINAQGFPKIGMMSIMLGALMNLALDPVFIFVFDLGVRGAALATVISQAISAGWVMLFLFSKRALIPLRLKNCRLDWATTKAILKMGTSNFVMQGTTCLVQVACNTTLQIFGGELYVGIMTVVNSIREILMLPVSGIVTGAQPVIGYNYGAKRYERVRAGIRFNTAVGVVYTLLAWAVVFVFTRFWFDLFSDDPQLANEGIKMLHIYFFGFVFMALQFAGQSTFQAVGDAKHAIIFSLLRKAIIVVPLTLILPHMGLGVAGVFVAEPISNVIGSVACYVTMRLTVYKDLTKKIHNEKEKVL